MSTLAVTGNALGTGVVTLTSPNTNTNRTITLPNETGTVLSNNGPLSVSSSAAAGSVVVDASGNLGVGVTPAVKLDVNGTGRFFSGANDSIRLLTDSGAMEITRAAGNAYIDLKSLESEDFDCRIQSIGTAGDMLLDTVSSLRFATNGAERVRIDSSGNFGIGTNSPSSFVTSLEQGATVGYADQAVTVGSHYQAGVEQYGFLRWSQITNTAASTVFRFYNANTEAARFDTSGNLFVGYTSGGATGGTSVVKANGYNTKAGVGAALGANIFNIMWGASTANLWIDSTNVGAISLTSDYRIKRNIQPQTTPAIERVMQLRPVTYQMADYGAVFKASEDVREGFIAHEVQAVIPSGAEGVKDDPNQVQSLRVDAILSVAVKAIQEQQAMIDELRAEVAALKAKA